MSEDAWELASEILKVVVQRSSIPTTEGVFLDHVAFDAVVVLASLTAPNIGDDMKRATLRILLDLVKDLPAEAGHAALRDEFHRRVGVPY